MSAPSSGLRGIIAVGHRLGQRRHGGQAGRGGGEGREDQRGLSHLLHAGTVGGRRGRGTGRDGKLCLNPRFGELVRVGKLFEFFLLSFLVFAQIGQMSGASHQNRSIARGCISGENVSAQPCVKVKLVLPSAQHMPGC